MRGICIWERGVVESARMRVVEGVGKRGRVLVRRRGRRRDMVTMSGVRSSEERD